MESPTEFGRGRNRSKRAADSSTILVVGRLVRSHWLPLASSPFRRVLLAITVVATLLAAGSSAGTASAATAPAASPVVFPTQIQHVVIVMDENQEWSTVWKYGPYERSLAQTYANASAFYSLRHASWPDYISSTSGQNTTFVHVLPNSATNVADQVESAGLTWTALEESMPFACDSTTNYAAKYDTAHNPFIWYSDIVTNHARCAAHDIPFTLTSWTARIAANNLTSYTFVTPNTIDDGHNYSKSASCSGTGSKASAEVKCADAWLKKFLAPLLANTALFHSTAVFVTYDEGTSSLGFNQSTGGPNGGHIYAVLVSPLACGGASHQPCSTAQKYTDFDILTTSQYLLGLPYTLPKNDNTAIWPVMTNLLT